MWRATAGYETKENNKNGNGGEDDWETDPDFINDVTEEEQRWGSKTVAGSGRTAGAINIQQLRSEVEKDDAELKKKTLESGPKASYGYGGKFGLQQDRMDKSAVGHDYIARVEKHASQIDAVKGFGGKFGIQVDRQDKSAVGWDHHEKVDKHASQKDYSSGFGGKYGVQTDRVDKTAVGWDHIEKTEKHESQKDYSKGFGGKFGVDKDRQDKSAVGWEYQNKAEKHTSQKDYTKGFGVRCDIQDDRKDTDKPILGSTNSDTHQIHKCAIEKEKQNKLAYPFEHTEKSNSAYGRPKPEAVSSAKASSLRARFENMARVEEEEDKKRAEEERQRRKFREQKEKEVAQKDEEERQRKLSIQNENNYVQEHREPVLAVRRSVAVPTPLVQATTAKSASPETPFSRKISPIVPQPPSDFKDVEEPVHRDSCTTKEESQLFNQQQSYLEPAYETLEDVREELCEEAGLSAIALYDYQAADSDEISFDPDDIITNIEMIDEGWWRGECRGQVGLFPANYVQLL